MGTTSSICETVGQERIVTIGGTFGALHDGHRDYIRLAFEYADRILIYVNSNDYTNGKKHYNVLSFESRVERIQCFIRDIRCEKPYEIRCLHSLEQLEFDYLENAELKDKIYMAIVSPDYYDFFLRINLTRETRGMKSFLVLVKLRMKDENNNDISSSNIHQNASTD